MVICKQCGTQNSDDGMFCSNCGAPLDRTNITPNADARGYYNPSAASGSVDANGYYNSAPPQQPQYQPTQQPPYQTPVASQQAQYQPYSQQPQGYQQYGQQYFDNSLAEHQQLAKSAKTLGIVAIIFSFIIPLVTWITGSQCFRKVNQVTTYATSFNNQELLDTAKTAKTLATIGVVISAINVFANVVFQIVTNQ